MEYIATTADGYLVCNTVEASNRARGAINGKQSHIQSPYDPQNTLNKTEIASKFDIKKILEDLMKNYLIITGATFGLFYLLRTSKVQLSKETHDMKDIIKLAGGITASVLVKDHTPV